MAFGRLELIAIGAVAVFALWSERERLLDEVRERKAEVAAAEAARDVAVKEKHAAELGLASAEAPKERIREVIRTVTLPATGEACSADPAVRAVYPLLERMRDAFNRDPASAPEAPRGSAVPLQNSSPVG